MKGRCNLKQYEHAGLHRRIAEIGQKMPPFPCEDWKPEEEAMNSVRSASEEVAAEFVCKGQAYAATRRRLANLIESKFAPVVAATEEAMKEKIRRAVKKELGFIIHS